MKIKTIGIKYPQKRLVMDILQDVDYQWIQNYANPIIKRVFNTYEIYKPIGDWDVTGYHTVNTVMITNKPWCCSFESIVPRGGQILALPRYENFRLQHNWFLKFVIKRLLLDNCKKLIAFSECNLAMQRLVYNEFPEYAEALNGKTCMLHVPQKRIAEAVPRQKATDGIIRFVFVGNDFIRKGGREIIEVLREIREIRSDFELHLITIPENRQNYAFGQWQDSEKEIDDLKNYIRSQPWIKLYSKLPNDEVINIIMKCDVGLLPSWADTYGYSLLEMQACGVPVISTNVRAMPEINANGWLLNMPVNYCREILINSFDDKKRLRKELQKQLYEIVYYLLEHKDDIQNHSIASLDYIEKYHSPDNYSDQIRKIYSEFI